MEQQEGHASQTTGDNMPSPSPHPRSGSNAFDMLMNSAGMKGSSGVKRKRSSSGDAVSNEKAKNPPSRFLSCPAGCGRHILSHSINAHLDGCLASQQQLEQQPKEMADEFFGMAKNLESHDIVYNISPAKGFPANSGAGRDLFVYANVCSHENDNHKDTLKENQHSDQSSSTTITPKDDDNDENKASTNVFAHMMKKSAEVFSADHLSSAPSTPKLIQRMHLHENGTVSVTCYESAPSRDLIQEMQQQQLQNSNLGRIVWSSTIQVRKNQDMDTPVELTVSSSIPSMSPDADRPRFVQKHSRLSVPVLKSILQKSIRRRKPLPSLRVAMELADKSLGDLLRRLPIIIIEDSTLHPDMPLLVWLMMAASKDYLIPMKMMKRVFSIVYEMASCPWRDALPKKANDDKEPSPKESSPLSIAWFQTQTVHRDNQLIQLAGNDVILWSILMRGNYGGMDGDIRMLRTYAKIWQNRFATRGIPESIKKRLSGGKSGKSSLNHWSQVPYFIHEGPAKQSSSRIDALVVSSWGQGGQPIRTCGIEALSMSDITTEGVDFHCSSVLKTAILDHSTVVQECLDYLQKEVPSTSGKTLPSDLENRREWLEGVLKSCMWNYSAGVNRRLPLDAVTKKDSDTRKHSLKSFWDLKILPRTKAFSERYVSDRLAG
jgi:hypothetical protein